MRLRRRGKSTQGFDREYISYLINHWYVTDMFVFQERYLGPLLILTILCKHVPCNSYTVIPTNTNA